MGYYYDGVAIFYTVKPELAPLIKEWFDTRIKTDPRYDIVDPDGYKWHGGVGYRVHTTARDKAPFMELCDKFKAHFFPEFHAARQADAVPPATPYAYEYVMVGDERDDVSEGFGGASCGHLTYVRSIRCDMPAFVRLKDDGGYEQEFLDDREMYRG